MRRQVAAAAVEAGGMFGARRVGRLPLILMGFCLRSLLHRPRDTLAAGFALAIAVAILVNALVMQTGPHPAPIFAVKPAPAPEPVRTAELGRPRSDLVADIQRELARHGFYKGTADGVYGARTDAAIRDFEEAASLRPSAEPNPALLAAIARSAIRAQPVAIGSNDAIAALLAPSPRIVAVQRALSDFGYGPVKATGIYDTATRAAIERFEKARRRPLSGQISDQLVRDLSTLTGRPLE